MKKELQAVSAKVDRAIYQQVVQFCKDTDIKVKKFVADAMIEKLEKEGRYAKPKRVH